MGREQVELAQDTGDPEFPHRPQALDQMPWGASA